MVGIPNSSGDSAPSVSKGPKHFDISEAAGIFRATMAISHGYFWVVPLGSMCNLKLLTGAFYVGNGW